MPIHVEVRLVGLPFGFKQRRRPLRESDRDGMRAGLHRNPHVQVLIHDTVIHAFRRRLNREGLNELVVNQQFHAIGAIQSLDMLISVTRQAYLKLVSCIQRKRVRDRAAAARS